MHRIAIVGLALTLSACGKSELEKKTEWQAFCTQGEFSAKQCEVLYVLKKGNEDAKDSADWAAINSSIAMGIGAANAGGRR